MGEGRTLALRKLCGGEGASPALVVRPVFSRCQVSPAPPLQVEDVWTEETASTKAFLGEDNQYMEEAAGAQVAAAERAKRKAVGG